MSLRLAFETGERPMPTGAEMVRLYGNLRPEDSDLTSQPGVFAAESSPDIVEHLMNLEMEERVFDFESISVTQVDAN